MTTENYSHANARRQCGTAPGTAPAPPLTAGLVLAVGWQQRFLPPTCFLDEGSHRAPLARAGPSSPGAGAAADSPLQQQHELGVGELLALPCHPLPVAAAPATLPCVARTEAPDLWHDIGARHCQHPRASQAPGRVLPWEIHPPLGDSARCRSMAVPRPQRGSCTVTVASETALTVSLLSEGHF